MQATKQYPSRRQILSSVSLLGLGIVLLPNQSQAQFGLSRFNTFGIQEGSEPYEITRSEQEWEQRLSPLAFAVLREGKTEKPFTSALDKEERAGIFHCGGCDLQVYSSQAKFDSKTGWPSFTQALENAVRVKPDRKFFRLRTEVHCRRCGGHFGHIFDDGPEPTGHRHCLNGAALVFRPLNS